MKDDTLTTIIFTIIGLLWLVICCVLMVNMINTCHKNPNEKGCEHYIQVNKRAIDNS